MVEQEVLVCEAQAEDAAGLSELLRLVATETEYLTRDADSPYMTLEETEAFILSRLQSRNQICLIAKVSNKVVGVLNVVAASHYRVAHIGDIFLAVGRDYWGYGVGQLLLEAVVDWAEHTPEIRRLELTVQARNKRAIHIYEKFGFSVEGIKKRGAKSKNGEFLDVYAMAKLID